MRPSDATGSRDVIEHMLGDRLALVGQADMARLGEACHGFFAVDEPFAQGRADRAGEVLARWRVAENLLATDLVIAADRLWAFVALRFPGWRWRREVPVFARLGPQVVGGRIDLLGECDAGYVLVDHKTFPGSAATLCDRASAAAAQLDLYARAVAAGTGQNCLGLYVHLPILGRIMEVTAAS